MFFNFIIERENNSLKYFKYSNYLNIGNPKSELFEVQFSNGQYLGYTLCSRPTTWMPDQYLRNHDSVHLSGIQMAFKNQTIWHPISFSPFNIQIPLYSHYRQFLSRIQMVEPFEYRSCIQMACYGLFYKPQFLTEAAHW